MSAGTDQPFLGTVTNDYGTRRRRRLAVRILVGLGGVLVAAVAILLIQAQRTPQGEPVYVALGSSYAAGVGLGPLQADSPLLCARGTGGYPTRLAAKLRLSLVDMSCSGAVTRHLFTGGQYFQGPQIRVVDRRTRLVTITVGGNDVGYAGDLSLLAARRSLSLFGWLVRLLWHGPDHSRDWQRLHDDLLATLRAIHQRAPAARVVIVTYPAVVPPAGSCGRLGLSDQEASLMRSVAKHLVDTTARAATEGGAMLVDMDRLGQANNACADQPWTNGWSDVHGAADHPTSAGAEGTARAIATSIRTTPR